MILDTSVEFSVLIVTPKMEEIEEIEVPAL